MNTARHCDFALNAPRIVEETIDDETVVIDTLTGKYYTLTSLASWVWNQLIRGHRLDEVARAAEVSAGLAASKVESFCADLVHYELIIPGETLRTLPQMDPIPPSALSDAPGLVMRVYRDMEDLIALDPIHEIDASAGWPHPQSHVPDAK
jgi:hypothetical protein